MERKIQKALAVAGIVWLANNMKKQAMSSEEQAILAGGSALAVLYLL